MTDRPITVCTWPNGRILARFRSLGDVVEFTSSPGPGLAWDVGFLFRLRGGGPLIEMLPGHLMDYSEHAIRIFEQKLLWFLREVGLTRGEPDQLPRKVFQGRRHDGESSQPRNWTPVVPLFSADPKSVVCAVEGIPVDTGEMADLARLTLPGLNVVVSSFESGPPIVALLSLGDRSGRPDANLSLVVFNGTVWSAKFPHDSMAVWPQTAAPTLGQALLNRYHLDGIYLESERAAWEAELEPGKLIVEREELEAFELLGEVCPLLWSWERFREWESGRI